MSRSCQLNLAPLRRYYVLAISLSVVLLCQSSKAQERKFLAGGKSSLFSTPADSSVTTSSILIRAETSATKTVQWKSLIRDSLRFLAVEHGFRCATEEQTREGFGNPFFSGYANSVRNLHGWADGDEFYVNYVGHPMQGAVASFIWMNNDPAYQDVYISSSVPYWKAKVRGLAYSFLQSAQFEIGPVSEASIGNIQMKYPQTGFVDLVMTPAGGLIWSLGEDGIDRYVVRYVETQTDNRWLRLLARAGLNPARSMANVMGGKVPWHRNNRSGVSNFDSEFEPMVIPTSRTESLNIAAGVDKFDFVVRSTVKAYLGEDAPGVCVGAEGLVAFRVAAGWQALLNVGGCKSLGLPEDVSGDSLDYMVGVRWSKPASTNWISRAQLLIGGVKVTQERMLPETKRELLESTLRENTTKPHHEQYTQYAETNNFALRAGLGLDVKLSNALALQVAGLDYSHAWGSTLSGSDYRHSLQFTAGMVLRIGTW